MQYFSQHSSILDLLTTFNLSFFIEDSLLESFRKFFKVSKANLHSSMSGRVIESTSQKYYQRVTFLKVTFSFSVAGTFWTFPTVSELCIIAEFMRYQFAKYLFLFLKDRWISAKFDCKYSHKCFSNTLFCVSNVPLCSVAQWGIRQDLNQKKRYVCSPQNIMQWTIQITESLEINFWMRYQKVFLTLINMEVSIQMMSYLCFLHQTSVNGFLRWYY